MAIALGRERRLDFNEKFARAEIERLAGIYLKHAAAAKSPRAKLEALRKTLFNEGGFRGDGALDAPETFYLDSVLATKKGYCLSLSLIALAIGDRAGTEFAGVAAPNHFFVQLGGGAEALAFETTRGGEIGPAEKLRATLGRGTDDKCIYLKPLDARGLEGALLHNRGCIALAKGDFDLARRDFDRAEALAPGLPEIYRNRGVSFGREKRHAEAILQFNAALLLFPNDADALYNRAICKNERGDSVGASGDLELALTIDPGRAKARELLDSIKRGTPDGNFAALQKKVVRPLSSKPENCIPGLRATFYKDKELSKEVTKRVDAEIDFDWQNGSPAPGVPADGFSARWDGWFMAPVDGKYSIFIIANDGSRFSLDGRMLLENWRDMGYENYYGSADVELIAGYHKIRVEHYDETGGARIILKIGVSDREKPLRLADHFFCEK